MNSRILLGKQLAFLCGLGAWGCVFAGSATGVVWWIVPVVLCIVLSIVLGLSYTEGLDCACVGLVLGCILGLVALFTLLTTRDSSQGIDRMRSSSNIRQLGIAFHAYHDDYRHFPPIASPMEEGMPPVSWRVRLLPYLDREALLKKYHFWEAWDSEHNLTLLDQMPDVYRSPPHPTSKRDTFIQAVVGEHSTFRTNHMTSI